MKERVLTLLSLCFLAGCACKSCGDIPSGGSCGDPNKVFLTSAKDADTPKAVS